MKKILAFNVKALSLLFLFSCALGGLYNRQFDYSLSKNQAVHKGKVANIILSDFLVSNLSLNIQNKTKGTIRLITDESLFTSPDGKTHRLLSGDTQKINASNVQPPIIIPRSARIDTGLYFNNAEAIHVGSATSYMYEPVMAGFGSHTKRDIASISGKKFHLLLTFKDSNNKRYEEYISYTIKEKPEPVAKKRK